MSKSNNPTHTFVVCAYKESPYLEKCIQSVLKQSEKSSVVISTGTPNDYIKEIAKKYELPMYVNTGKTSIADDWNFAVSCVDTDLVTLAHQDDIYEKICSIVKKQNVKIVVDATKNLLVQALKYNPFLIKPNNEELGEIFGVEIHTKEDAYVYGKKLKEMGAQNVLVSMGKIGAALIDEAGQEYFIKSPEGKRVNTVGSGDSMVAGFIAGFLKYNNYNDAVRMGVSAGSASALSKYLATKEEVYNLFNNI